MRVNKNASTDPKDFLFLYNCCQHDARLALFNEVGDIGVYDGERIKMFSSGGGVGGDKFQIRALFKMPFDYTPNFTMVCIGNSLPRIDPADTYKRLAAFRMESQFVDPDMLANNAYGRPKDDSIKGKLNSASWKAAFTFLVLSSYTREEPLIHSTCVCELPSSPSVAHVRTQAPEDLLETIFERVAGECSWPAAELTFCLAGAFICFEDMKEAIQTYCQDNDLENHGLMGPEWCGHHDFPRRVGRVLKKVRGDVEVKSDVASTPGRGQKRGSRNLKVRQLED